MKEKIKKTFKWSRKKSDTKSKKNLTMRWWVFKKFCKNRNKNMTYYLMKLKLKLIQKIRMKKILNKIINPATNTQLWWLFKRKTNLNNNKEKFNKNKIKDKIRRKFKMTISNKNSKFPVTKYCMTLTKITIKTPIIKSWIKHKIHKYKWLAPNNNYFRIIKIKYTKNNWKYKKINSPKLCNWRGKIKWFLKKKCKKNPILSHNNI